MLSPSLDYVPELAFERDQACLTVFTVLAGYPSVVTVARKA
jgi:hypothetical protein